MTQNLYENLWNLIFKGGKSFPKDIRIFVPYENNYVYVNNGHATSHFSIEPLMKNLNPERGEILDGFAKFEFVIFELLRFNLSGALVSKPTMEVVKALSPFQRITILNKLKIIDDDLFQKLRKIFNLRNEFAHKFDAKEILYDGKLVFSNEGFDEFKDYLQTTWDLLGKEYAKALSSTDLEPLIKKITDFQNPPI